MAKEKADAWTEGERRVAIMEIIFPDRIPADELAGLIHVALRQKYPSLGPMEYHAFKLADFRLKDKL